MPYVYPVECVSLFHWGSVLRRLLAPPVEAKRRSRSRGPVGRNYHTEVGHTIVLA